LITLCTDGNTILLCWLSSILSLPIILNFKDELDESKLYHTPIAAIILP
jgi:hypothetical protein